jgi:hypothetical protein
VKPFGFKVKIFTIFQGDLAQASSGEGCQIEFHRKMRNCRDFSRDIANNFSCVA